MSTYMPKAGQVERKWYVIDAAGKPLGRVAAPAAAANISPLLLLMLTAATM